MTCERIEAEQLSSHRDLWSSAEGLDDLTWERHPHVLFVAHRVHSRQKLLLFPVWTHSKWQWLDELWCLVLKLPLELVFSTRLSKFTFSSIPFLSDSELPCFINHLKPPGRPLRRSTFNDSATSRFDCRRLSGAKGSNHWFRIHALYVH